MIRSFNFISSAALAALLVAPFAMAGCNVEIAGGGCKVGDTVIAPGTSFAADCNTCTCNDDGSVACTEMACFDGCLDESGPREVGETWGDGCNSCTCLASGEIACTDAACPETCEWDGQTYPVGASFPAGDGCNSCSCDPGGQVGCTLIWCASCSYGGQTYNPGESFPAGDGCNTCTCDDEGMVACTKIACTCDPEGEWWRDYVGSSPAECQLIDFGCPPNTTYFGNNCGCGCEQSPDCPEYFNCQPPNPCDPQKIMMECPYSKIAY